MKDCNYFLEYKEIEKRYGREMTIGEFIDTYQRPCKCPKCSGSGIVWYERIIPYPDGFPDSGWVPPTTEKTSKECDLCDGYGWTKKKFNPVEKTIVTGYEEE